MILADTSIWIGHFRRADPELVRLLEAGLVLGHAAVIGEIALGSLKNHAAILWLLQALPAAPVAEPEEILTLIDREGLAGQGLGLVDVHLLAGARLASGTLWTRDPRLAAAAEAMGIAHRR